MDSRTFDAERSLSEAEERASQARKLLEMPGFIAACTRLRAAYIQQWRDSEPIGPQGAMTREGAFFMIRALEALLEDLQAAMRGEAIARRNLGGRVQDMHR